MEIVDVACVVRAGGRGAAWAGQQRQQGQDQHHHVHSQHRAAVETPEQLKSYFCSLIRFPMSYQITDHHNIMCCTCSNISTIFGFE